MIDGDSDDVVDTGATFWNFGGSFEHAGTTYDVYNQGDHAQLLVDHLVQFGPIPV